MTKKYFESVAQVLSVPVTAQIDWAEILPKKNIALGEPVVGRYEEQELDRSVWSTLADPVYTDDYAKFNFVDRYFSICLFSLKRVGGVSIAANQSYESSVMVTHSSVLRNSVSESLRIETVLRGSAASEGGSTAEASVTSAYELAKTSEYTQEHSKVTTTTLRYDPVDYDRDAVLWDLVKTVAIYRVAEGKTALVGLGDFYVGTSQATYRRQNGQAVSAAEL